MTEPTPRRRIMSAIVSRFHLIVWLIGVEMAGELIYWDYVRSQRSHGLSINGQALWGRDFVNVFSSGRLVIEGRLYDLYDKIAYRAWQADYFGGGIREHNYSYPPVTLFYTPLFGALPYVWALALWSILSVLMFGFAARPWLLRENLPAWLGFVLPSSIVCVWAGHYGLFVGALWLAAWHNLEKRPKLAGFFTGLLIIKPHMAVLMPILFLRRKAWTAMGAAAATVIILVGLSILFFGLDLWHIYLTSTSETQLNMLHATRAFFLKMMPTISPALFALGFPASLVWPAQVAVASITIILMWRFQPADAHRAGLSAAVATFLILPYAFNYDMTVVGLAALIVLAAASKDVHVIAALFASTIFLLPTFLISLNKTGIWIAPLLLAAFLFQLLWRAERAPRWDEAAA